MRHSSGVKMLVPFTSTLVDSRQEGIYDILFNIQNPNSAKISIGDETTPDWSRMLKVDGNKLHSQRIQAPFYFWASASRDVEMFYQIVKIGDKA